MISPPMSDPITPAHYDGTTALEAMVAKHGLLAVIGFCECNSDKYRYRAGRKPGVPAEQDEAKARQYEAFAADLRGRLPQVLLTGERLAEIREKAAYFTKHEDLLRPDFEGRNPYFVDLLAHADALQAFYTTRDNQLCETHDEFVGDVAHELRLLLDEEFCEPTDDFKRGINHERKQNNSLIRGLAAKLNISL